MLSIHFVVDYIIYMILFQIGCDPVNSEHREMSRYTLSDGHKRKRKISEIDLTKLGNIILARTSKAHGYNVKIRLLQVLISH